MLSDTKGIAFDTLENIEAGCFSNLKMDRNKIVTSAVFGIYKIE